MKCKTKKMANGGPVMPMAASNPPARSNAGGAVRGQARAAQVHAMNAARKAPVMPIQAKVPAFANGGKVKMGSAKGKPMMKGAKKGKSC